MNKTEVMIEKVKALAEASSCCAEAKEAANNWLAAVNTEKQDEAAKALIEEIAADIIPIDGLIKLRTDRRSSVQRRQPRLRITRKRSSQKAQSTVTARHAQRLLRS